MMPDLKLERSKYLDERAQGKMVLWAATIQIEDHSIECAIINISNEGATICLAQPLPCGTSVLLQSTRLGELRAETLWQEGNRVELRFSDDPDKVAMKVATAHLTG
jgi:hypothetical protein